MPWVRIDEEFVQHPKVVQVGPFGVALQVAALCYANRNLTDGFIPYGAVRMLLDFNRLGENVGDRVEQEFWSEVGAFNVASRLVDAGMWLEVEGGYQIHDFEDYQPTRTEVLAERKRNSQAGKRSAQARKQRKQRSVQRSVNTPFNESATTRQPVPVPEPLNHGVATEGDPREETLVVLTPVEHARPVVADTRAVFDAWTTSTGKARAKLDPKRQRRIQAALKAYPLDDVLDAVQGWRNSPHHCGQNDRGTVYNDLDLLLRDAEHIERFRDLHRQGPSPPPVGKRTQQMLNTYQQMRAYNPTREVNPNGHDLGAVAADRRPPQRELARPADRTADSP